VSSGADMLTRVTDLLRERMAIEVADPHTDLIASGYLDSLSFVELLQHIEAEFDYRVRIEDLELEHVRTVSAIAAFVASRGRPDSSKEARRNGHPSIP
jgi:acyl carrier protein